MKKIKINEIICGDCIEVLKTLPDNSVDSVITDPPYELGFMGKGWDKTGIANSVDMWKDCLRVLKPGGHLLSFGGTRTYHRMAVAIEEAGFEIRDMIEWVYGSGFPKSLNIGKAVDKLQGNEREDAGFYESPEHTTGWKGQNKVGSVDFGASGYKDGEKRKLTKGTSEWEGWGTALKPAHEPIVVARKPLSEKSVAENVLRWGTGGINIDESRVDVADSEKEHFEKEWDREQSMSVELGGVAMNKGLKAVSLRDNVPSGRFPANLIHDSSDEVVRRFPNDSQRFFYCAKASKSERNMGCEGLEDKEYKRGIDTEGRVTNDLMERFKTIPSKNNHPTVKPLALMEYLIKMVTPPKGIVLDPFAGSGSTLIAAKQNGFQYIGIEKEEEYIKIAKARLNSIPERLF